MVKILPRLSLGPDRREWDPHGTEAFPCEIYETHLQNHHNKRIPEHWHNEIEIGYVEKGKIQFSCNKKNYVLQGDDIYFISSSHQHSMSDLSGRSVFFSIVFHEKMVTGPDSVNAKYIYPVMQNREHAFLTFQDSYILSILKEIVDLMEEHLPGYELLIRNHLSSIILWIFRKYHLDTAMPESSEISARIERMLNYMAEHYMEDIQVGEIADYGHVSTRECYRAFRTVLDSSPTEYLHQYRLKKAADLLVTSNLKIFDIAGKCGYNQPGYFATRFKKAYGCSPKEYRRQNKNHSGQ